LRAVLVADHQCTFTVTKLLRILAKVLKMQ
jgi:hypothetical protein